MISLSLGLTLGANGSGGPAFDGAVPSGLVSQSALGEATVYITDITLPGLVSEAALGDVFFAGEIVPTGLVSESALGGATAYVTDLTLPGLVSLSVAGTTSVSSLGATGNGSGTIDITVDDGTFSVTISGSAYTHQNGTWGPFDTADLDSGPVNVVAAQITGNTGLGDTLTAAPGVWVWDTANGTATVTGEWQNNGSGLGDTDLSYTLVSGDSGDAITYLEAADDDVAGTVTQVSNTITAGNFSAITGEILTEAGAAMLAEDGQVMLTEAFTGTEMLAESGDDMLTEDDRLMLTEAA